MKVPQMKVQHIAEWWSNVRVLGYMCGKESVREGEGKVCQGYWEQHPALSDCKDDDRLFVVASGKPPLPVRAGRCHTNNTCKWCDSF